MNFKHSAFIENTPEMREWLEGLGYNSLVVDASNSILYTRHFDEGWFYTTTPYFIYTPKGIIDCRNNPDLFKAVTAIRDDSDYMQWFYNRQYNEWSICEQGNMFDYFKLDWCIPARKATLEELIEHFK